MKTNHKILYIDVPFIGLCGGDKNRSKFLYESLSNTYETDILLIKNKPYDSKILNAHKKNKLYTIKSKKPPFYLPQSLYDFDSKSIAYFTALLQKNKYDTLVFKFNATAILANTAKKVLPLCNIIIDVDMLSSRICYDAWKNNPTIKNRFYLIEYLKLRQFEKKFIKNDFTFLYTNDKEIEQLKKQYNLCDLENHILLPNVFHETKEVQKCSYKNKFILFYGMLNSTVNETAFKFLTNEIYPLIKQKLIKENIKIVVIGKNKTAVYNTTYKNIDVIGEVDDLSSYINACEFVFLPLKIASGTLTRVLEAAFFKKAVLTTSIGIEGLKMQNSAFIKDKPEDIATKIKALINNSHLCQSVGLLANFYVKEHHSKQNVAQKLYSIISSQKRKRINVIHIPRRFTKTHWGGTENVIMSYATGLKDFNIHSEIYTTTILNNTKQEQIQGIKIDRFSYFYPYINLKKQIKEKLDFVGGNIFSFSLFFSLLFKKNIDLIHLHTFKRMGGIARVICKIRNIPYVVSVHGGIYNRKVTPSPTLNDKSFEWGKILGFMVGSRRVIKDSDAIICLNTNEYEAMKKQMNNHNILLLPNSVNIETFNQPKNSNIRKKYHIGSEKFLCLISGRIDEQKNQLFALEVLNSFKGSVYNIHILLVGNITDNEYFSQIQHYIHDNKLEKDVTVITNMQSDSKELVDAYLNADALILPSLHEPFGIVVLEAWASALPVLVSQTAGVCNFIEHKKNALMFNHTSELSLRSNLINIIEDKQLQMSLCHNAKISVASFDRSIINSHINSIYRNILQKNNA